jgi:hypothetical protein
MQVNLPNFEFSSDFTLAAWVLSDKQTDHAVALSVECPEVSKPLLKIGDWRQGRFRAILSNQSILDSSESIYVGSWHHVTFTQTKAHMNLFVDGRMVATAPAKDLKHEPVSQVRPIHTPYNDVALINPSSTLS